MGQNGSQEIETASSKTRRKKKQNDEDPNLCGPEQWSSEAAVRYRGYAESSWGRVFGVRLCRVENVSNTRRAQEYRKGVGGWWGRWQKEKEGRREREVEEGEGRGMGRVSGMRFRSCCQVLNTPRPAADKGDVATMLKGSRARTFRAPSTRAWGSPAKATCGGGRESSPRCPISPVSF